MIIINKKLQRLAFESHCDLVVGDRGSGKSTYMALKCEAFLNAGYRVFCQYPYRGAFQIPLVEKKVKDTKKYIIDKDWLYNTDLSHSLVMIDEARTVWNARAYTAWTESDEDFFNMIRKTDTYLCLATQRYDGVDLNIRYACDYTYFIQQNRFLKNWSTVDVSRSVQLKVADKQTQVVSKGYSKNAMKVTWDIGEVPIAYCHFYRKPFYGDFKTNHTLSEKLPANVASWDSILTEKDLDVMDYPDSVSFDFSVINLDEDKK